MIKQVINTSIWCLLDAKMNIYSQDLLLWTFVCVNNVLCQSFNLWTKYPKPLFTQCNNIPKCNDSFTFVRWMFQISNATTFMIEVAWSQSAIFPCVHYSTIFYIMWCKWDIVPSKRIFELSSSSKSMTLFIGSTTSSMVLIKPMSMTLLSP